MFMSLGVVQLNSFDTAQVVKIASPFTVADLLRKSLFEDQFISLSKKRKPDVFIELQS